MATVQRLRADTLPMKGAAAARRGPSGHIRCAPKMTPAKMVVLSAVLVLSGLVWNTRVPMIVSSTGRDLMAAGRIKAADGVDGEEAEEAATASSGKVVDPSIVVEQVDYSRSVKAEALGRGFEWFWRYKSKDGVENTMAVRNLCYSLQQKSFVALASEKEAIAKAAGEARESGFNGVFGIRWVDDVPKSRVLKWIPGYSVVSTDLSIVGATGAHFFFWVEPVFSAVALLRKKGKISGGEINVIYKKMPERSEVRAAELDAWDLMFREVPRKNLLGLESFERDGQKDLVCMDNAFVMNYQYSSVVNGEETTEYLRENMRKATGLPVVNDCADPGANRKTVHLLSRMVFSRKFANLDAIVDAIHAEFGPDVRVVVFESANSRCSGATVGRKGLEFCQDLPSSILGRPLKDHALFNNMTFVVSVHGAGNMNYLFLPKGAHAVEIMPVGVRYNMYGELARRIGLGYFDYDEQNRTGFEGAGLGRFSGAGCPGNNECRRVSKELPVHVTVSGRDSLGPVLAAARASWLQRCGGGR